MLKFLAAAIFCVSPAAAQSFTVQLPDSLYDQSSPVVWVKQIAQYCEGPLWQPATGTVYFTEQFGNQTPDWPIWKIKPGTADTGSIFVTTRQSNGLELDPQGRVVACQDGRLARYTDAGALDTVLVQSGQNGVTFGQANDLSIGPAGDLYFTDLNTNVFYLNPARQLAIAVGNQRSANGIEWLPEQSAVYVNQNNQVTRYSVQSDGTLADGTKFASVNDPDGGTIDTHGNHYVASYMLGEFFVFNSQGDSLGFIRLNLASGAGDTRPGAQGNTDNCVFGGSDNTTLYMTGDGGLYSLQLKIPGRTLPSSTAVKPVSLQSLPPRRGIWIDALGRRFLPENHARLVPALRILR